MPTTHRMRAAKKNSSTVVVPTLPPRNPVIATLAKQGLRLGAGAHRRSESAQRRAAKVALNKSL